ncbi:hypothetical protein MCOR02_006357 [Pyricularia oryzae]|uniref:Uncharacterized protein n=1 Tax=Pyricularia oryzae TaxID=318829 RepID=A0A4P7NJI1_PYROR|nr:hypothetical protein MCOR02_006357 [Pyricularia oryzae]KAI6313120.1 hypothetical protein MCOR34_005330 [Pyricularia oryzae]KAI6445735.1 hypothetical protein MCOR17_010925 [Pyricularia oryzae]KAI6494089.1 hypothetical protein MCOR13_007645 [Pyricularia oryzae]KAI6578781.1 hypothetical protein MCOR04_006317 [Pyricularia oryzae]
MDGIDEEVGLGPRSLTRPTSPPRKRQKTGNERDARPDPSLKSEWSITESNSGSETASEPDIDSGSKNAQQPYLGTPAQAVFRLAVSFHSDS